MTSTRGCAGSEPAGAQPARPARSSVLIEYSAAQVAQHAAAASVTTISLAELAYGLHTADPLINAAREQRYHWIVATFDPIAFDTESARVYGALCAGVRAAGRNPRPRRFDLLIAAVAVTNGLPLLTRNAADFAGLQAMALIPISSPTT